jgi:hypothetical protein
MEIGAVYGTGVARQIPSAGRQIRESRITSARFAVLVFHEILRDRSMKDKTLVSSDRPRHRLSTAVPMHRTALMHGHRPAEFGLQDRLDIVEGLHLFANKAIEAP